MPIAWSSDAAKEIFNNVKRGLRAEMDRWDRLTPEQRAKEQAEIDERQEKLRKELAKREKWLDWCVANKVDPNLARLS